LRRPRTPGLRGAALLRRIAILVVLAIVPFVALAALFVIYVALGVREGADEPTGRIAGSGVRAPVVITRDARFIPHVRAQTEHDLFLTEGYLQGSDRLFQLDLYRRLVEGRLAEILGSVALDVDVDARTIDLAQIARAQLAALPLRERENLDAFAAGVNFAIATRPLPAEFRLLAYVPEPWTPTDSLAASFATVLALTDSWNDVATRADVIAALGPRARDAFYSISDPLYDTPTAGHVRAPVAPLPPLALAYPSAAPLFAANLDARAGTGSNDFAAGAALTRTHRTLLANDPHLERHFSAAVRTSPRSLLAERDFTFLGAEGGTTGASIPPGLAALRAPAYRVSQCTRRRGTHAVTRATHDRERWSSTTESVLRPRFQLYESEKWQISRTRPIIRGSAFRLGRVARAPHINERQPSCMTASAAGLLRQVLPR